MLIVNYENIKSKQSAQEQKLPGKSILKKQNEEFSDTKKKLLERGEKIQVKQLITQIQSDLTLEKRKSKNHEPPQQIEPTPKKKSKNKSNDNQQFIEQENITERYATIEQEENEQYNIFDQENNNDNDQESVEENLQDLSVFDTNQEKDLLEGLDYVKNKSQQRVEVVDILDNFERKWSKHQDRNANSQRYKTGKYTEQEIKIVFQSLLDYAKNKQLTEEELAKICSDKSKKDFHKAWNDIAKALPDRTLQSVHNMVHRKFNPINNQGSWSAEEEQHLLQLVNEHGRKWYDISKMINRTPLNVRDKYKSIGEENNIYRDQNKWTLAEVLGLILYIQRYTGKQILRQNWLKILIEKLGQAWDVIDVKEKIFKQRQGKRRSFVTCEQDQLTLNTFCYIIDKEQLNNLEINNIPWTKISHKIKSKSKDDIRNFWYTTLNLWFLQPSNIDLTKEEENQIIRDICQQKIEHDDEIDYNQVLPDNNQIMLQDKKQKWYFIKKRVSLRKNLTTRQILDILQKEQQTHQEYQVNLSFATQVQTDLTPLSINISTIKKNLFQSLLEKYREVQQDIIPTFSDIE